MTAISARPGIMFDGRLSIGGCGRCRTGECYRRLKHAVELVDVVELLGRVNLAQAWIVSAQAAARRVASHASALSCCLGLSRVIGHSLVGSLFELRDLRP
jgi:hypothetical protein